MQIADEFYDLEVRDYDGDTVNPNPDAVWGSAVRAAVATGLITNAQAHDLWIEDRNQKTLEDYVAMFGKTCSLFMHTFTTRSSFAAQEKVLRDLFIAQSALGTAFHI